AVGDLDDQAAVGAAQPEPHGGRAVLEGVGDEFAGGQHAQVVQLGGEAPAGQDAGGEGPGAGRRLDAAEEVQGGVAEQLALRAPARRVLEHQDGDVVVVVGGDAGRADQAVADDLGGAGRTGQGAFQGGDALVEVGVAPFHEAVGVEDGGGAGPQRDRTGGVHPVAGAEGRADGLGCSPHGAVLVPHQDREVAGGGVHQAAL